MNIDAFFNPKRKKPSYQKTSGFWVASFAGGASMVVVGSKTPNKDFEKLVAQFGKPIKWKRTRKV